MNKTVVNTALAGALLLGGAGAALIPSIVAAADPAASSAPAATAPDGTPGQGDHGGQRGPGGPGGRYGHIELVSNNKIAADVIGISESDLVAQLQAGKSLAEVATANSVDPQKVIDALVADEQAEIAAAVTAGTETQAQADEELATLVQRITDRVNHAGMGPGGKGGHGGPAGANGPGGPFGHVETVSDMKIAADAIGISETDLITALQGGQSIADVAAASNVDVQKVIDALVADEQAEIAAAVTAGTETQAQADQELATLVQRITDRVNHTGMGPGGRGGHGHGPAGDPNQAPAPAATPTPAG